MKPRGHKEGLKNMDMNECRTVRELLPRFHEKSLEPHVASWVEGHLKTCSGCSGEYSRLERSWELLDAWHVPEPADGFPSRVLARLHQERRNAWIRKALPAAALFLIMLGIVWFSVARQQEKAAEQAARDSQPGPVLTVNLPPGSEDEIISRLQLIEEKEFYDKVEEMKKIDLLPLVEEKGPKKGDDRSLLDGDFLT